MISFNLERGNFKINLKKPTVFIPAIMLGVFILLILSASLYLDWQFKKPLLESGESVNFSIQEGWGVGKIASELQKEGLISNAFYFKAYIWEKGWGEKLQAGEYELSPNLSIIQIAKKIRSGEVVDDSISITIPPGQRIERIENIFKRAGFKNKINFLDFKVADFSDQFDFLKDVPQQKNLEGFLYPETLKFFKDAKSREIIEKILSVFGQNIDAKLRAAAKAKNMDFYEVLTLASIVEKEIPSSKPGDQKIVAGIFWKRLKNNYPLESCVTVEYVLGIHKSQYSIADTLVASPYNTYANAGLPPTPITSPRRSAVEAVIFFEPSNYNFFLSDPATGNTIFSTTLREHNINKNKYLN